MLLSVEGGDVDARSCGVDDTSWQSSTSGRIAAVYIRNIDHSRQEEIESIAADLKQSGVDMLLMDDAGAAAQHAAGQGLITEEQAGEVLGSEE